MRIDYVITGLDIGGAEYQVVSLLERLAKNGHTMRLISLIPPSSAILIERISATGVPLLSLDMRSSKDLPLALLRLCKILRQTKPDIVHSHMVHANIITRLARLFLPSLKIISTAHNTHEGGKFRDWAYRLTNPLCQLNTTISDTATHRFTNENVLPRQNTRTVFNGIDTDKFFPQASKKMTSSPFCWLAVGRLVEQKDYPTLIKAFTLIPNSKLLIAGQGPLDITLFQQVKYYGLEDRIEFIGLSDDTSSLYRQADGFVLSSAWEGYGLVVAEAMSSELPVVVTDSGGPREIVGSDGRTGLIVPIKDPLALASAMIAIEEMPSIERHKMGVFGRVRIREHFSLNEIVTQWEHLYIELKNKKNLL
ncbi:TPA: glycosyltransferase [Citrobacter farmeri]|jgi:glycosyltransferase involved in cell wall biosynthesis|uniref:glycosyltransferase n=1 Tax=Enterobacteriaceae TaxID=543 RepID=UPI002E3541F9|nr:glycosyltransferase [Citrobacter freundii]HBC0359433.1 glycosyltransferase [Citrobacter farmeri]HBZ8836846.1 glycosyltransferase [Citrobacter farmeri]HBZ9184095.1 glycosyltransferase [Citrobacter farmeri]HCA1887095.1 glycosyltransferase [Citrobacter farmeri]